MINFNTLITVYCIYLIWLILSVSSVTSSNFSKSLNYDLAPTNAITEANLPKCFQLLNTCMRKYKTKPNMKYVFNIRAGAYMLCITFASALKNTK